MPLTVYSEAGCNGTSKVLKDSEVNLAKAGVKFTIQVNECKIRNTKTNNDINKDIYINRQI